eukprot:gene19074-14166_t
MERNIEVTEENQSVIVDSLRSIAEVVIWGDQNSGDVFDYFLEKDMVGYFDKVLLQNPGTYVNTQLLQTLKKKRRVRTVDVERESSDRNPHHAFLVVEKAQRFSVQREVSKVLVSEEVDRVFVEPHRQTS